MKDMLAAPYVAEMIRTTANMYYHGWDERNSGNISLLLSEEEAAEIYMKIAHLPIKATITDDEMRRLAGHLKLTIREGFLD